MSNWFCTECEKSKNCYQKTEKGLVCTDCLIKSYENVKAAKKHLDAYGHFANRIMNHQEDFLTEAMEEWEEAMTLLYGGKTTPSTRCSVEGCEKAATYDAPEDFCDKHWWRWWDQDLLSKMDSMRDAIKGYGCMITRNENGCSDSFDDPKDWCVVCRVKGILKREEEDE